MKIKLILKSFNKNCIKNTLHLLRSSQNANFVITSVFTFPTKIKRFCVLRSPHIDKDSREHFEIKFYKSLVYIELKNYSSLNSLLSIKIPEGVFYTFKKIFL